jgi:hypothetical protein
MRFCHTQQERAMKRKTIAPRNPLVAAAKFRKAGAHGASEKAQRRKAKMELGLQDTGDRVQDTENKKQQP